MGGSRDERRPVQVRRLRVLTPCPAGSFLFWQPPGMLLSMPLAANGLHPLQRTRRTGSCWLGGSSERRAGESWRGNAEEQGWQGNGCSLTRNAEGGVVSQNGTQEGVV